MRSLSVKLFLSNKGKHIWFFALTNELLVCKVPPQKAEGYDLILTLDGTKLSMGPITYVGEL